MKDTLPHWNMTVLYPGLESEEFEQGFNQAAEAIDGLVKLFDRHSISAWEDKAISEETVRVVEEILDSYNEVIRQARTLEAYIDSFITTDSRNDLAQAKASEFDRKWVQMSILRNRFMAWIGSLDVEALIESSQMAHDHAFFLRQAQTQARHMMAPSEETLAAELDLSGGTAWARLHGNFSSQLSVPVEIDGKTRELPMSAVRNLASNPDREVRRRAYEAEIKAWEAAAVPLAAAMNGIKGQVNTLAEKRGWETPLDAALFDNHIDRQTLEAMMEAARESFPDFRRYLQAKARALNIPVLSWYDMFAPLSEKEKAWPFEQASEFVVEQFHTFSPELGGLAKRAFSENWIDAEPRPGKRDGAFCMWLQKDESRILSNYKPAFGGVSTLAHELGHAFHNLNLKDRTMLQRGTPMTLAETASIFCQTIVRNAALENADAREQLSILEADLQDSCQVVVDITSRFLFEQNVFSKRRERELSAGEFCGLMAEAQKETYGDGLDPDTYHSYMWAMKPHYYSPGRSFYNFPYMFGLLFGLGLYARYKKDPDGFRDMYTDLLSSTGMFDAAELAGRFEIDIRSTGFWRLSLDVVRDNINRFETLITDI